MELGDNIILKINDTTLVGELSLQINADRNMIDQSDKKLDWKKYKPGKKGMTIVVTSLCDPTSESYGYEEAREAWENGTLIDYTVGDFTNQLAKLESGTAYIRSVSKSSPNNDKTIFTANLVVTGASVYDLSPLIWTFESDLEGWLAETGSGQVLTATHNTTNPISGVGDALLDYATITGVTNTFKKLTDYTEEIQANEKLKVTFDYKLVSGTCVYNTLVFTLLTDSGAFVYLDNFTENITGTGQISKEVTITGTHTDITQVQIGIGFAGNNLYSVQVDNITFQKI